MVNEKYIDSIMHGATIKVKNCMFVLISNLRVPLEDLRVDGRIILKCIFKKKDWFLACIGLIWLMVGTSGGLL